MKKWLLISGLSLGCLACLGNYQELQEDEFYQFLKEREELIINKLEKIRAYDIPGMIIDKDEFSYLSGKLSAIADILKHYPMFKEGWMKKSIN